ncbi:MAG: preprotein translocase subunit YajC [Alphaproteobacteria bacterium]|nr:preprotein translocase subunit YajC [Alphaproteobacteria bacterium]
MFDVMNFLVSSAWAADAIAPVIEPVAGAAANQDAGSMVMRFMPFFLILVVFYFFVIRPQQKKADAVDQMMKKLKKGDKILTTGGLVGTITKFDGDHYVMLEIAKGVDVKIVKSTISGLASESFPANQK